MQKQGCPQRMAFPMGRSSEAQAEPPWSEVMAFWAGGRQVSTSGKGMTSVSPRARAQWLCQLCARDGQSLHFPATA